MHISGSTRPSGDGSVAGIDGAGGRWLVAILDDRKVDMHLANTAAEALDLTERCDAVGVDMPLFIPETGARESELQVRAFLGPARSSLFITPVRAAIDAEDWARASAISRELTGKGISKQSWHLSRYILEWARTERSDRVVEVHPESSFRALCPDTEYSSKKRARGCAQRLLALSTVLDTESLLRDAAQLDDGPAVDDVLDAAVAAWSARRWHDGTAKIFGRGPDRIVV